jgi:uncharacterized protein
MNNKFINKFKVLIFGVCFFLISATRLTAQHTEPMALDNSLLWEISGQGLGQSSFLFGTIHLIPEDKYFWTEKMDEAFFSSEEVVFELNMEEMTDMSMMMSIMDNLLMSGDTSLSDLLSDEEYGMVKAHFDKLGLPLFMFKRMKPFFLTVFLSEDFAKGSLQDGSLKSYEMELAQMAKNQGKLVDGLETVEFQAKAFDAIPYKVQAQMLVSSLKNEDESSGKGELDTMIELYTQQNIQQLGEMMSQTGEDFSEFEEILLNSRNRAWIDVMIEKMNSHKVFFAVGAGHLPGREGVIQLLRNRGYTVKPVK